jgi:hypothetical protein
MFANLMQCQFAHTFLESLCRKDSVTKKLLLKKNSKQTRESIDVTQNLFLTVLAKSHSGESANRFPYIVFHWPHHRFGVGFGGIHLGGRPKTHHSGFSRIVDIVIDCQHTKEE